MEPVSEIVLMSHPAGKVDTGSRESSEPRRQTRIATFLSSGRLRVGPALFIIHLVRMQGSLQPEVKRKLGISKPVIAVVRNDCAALLGR